MRTKFLSKLFVLALCMPLVFSSCSDDDDDNTSSSSNNNNQPQGDQFVYDVDGDSKDASDSIFVAQIGGNVVLTADESGAYPKGSVTINFPDTLSTGTYNIGGQSGLTMTYQLYSDANSTTPVPYTGISGVLNLTTNNPDDGAFEGSFDFTAFYLFTQDTVEITNGQFRVNE